MLVVAINPGFLGLVVGDQAPANIPRFGQWPGYIETGAIAVPIAGLPGNAGLHFAGWALADQVDGGRRVAHAADQARSTAHDFDTVIHRHALRVVVQAGTGGHTVHLIVLDGKATRPVGVAFRAQAIADHGDARGGLERIGQVGQALVIQALAGHHGQRLWGFLGCKVQARRAAGRIGGVQPGALGSRARGLAGNRHRT
ncbi:hypothetical protein D3C76_1007950 [compost metagenome]